MVAGVNSMGPSTSADHGRRRNIRSQRARIAVSASGY
jgi:hypothetical protein